MEALDNYLTGVVLFAIFIVAYGLIELGIYLTSSDTNKWDRM